MSSDGQRSDAVIFFGATGDLAYKQIFPALQALVTRHNLDIPIVGVAEAGWSLDQLKARARDSLTSHGVLDDNAFSQLLKLLRYVDGDYHAPETFAQLRKVLGDSRRPLHYFAIPPTLFPTVVEGLANSHCAAGARVVVKKPFGRDLASARQSTPFTTLGPFTPTWARPTSHANTGHKPSPPTQTPIPATRPRTP